MKALFAVCRVCGNRYDAEVGEERPVFCQRCPRLVHLKWQHTLSFPNRPLIPTKDAYFE